MSTEPQITVQQLDEKIKAGETLVLIDVRETFELENGALEGIHHIPMADVPENLGEFDKDAETIIICRTGNRSGNVTLFMQAQGFTQVFNLAGGMNEWAREIGGSVKEY